MLSVHIAGKRGKYYLMVRDYFAQGINPNYNKICNLLNEEADSLIKSPLIESWMNEDTFINPNAENPYSYIYCEVTGKVFKRIKINIPENALLSRKNIELEYPLNIDSIRYHRLNGGNINDILRFVQKVNIGFRDTNVTLWRNDGNNLVRL